MNFNKLFLDYGKLYLYLQKLAVMKNQSRINILSTLLLAALALGLVSMCTSHSFNESWQEGRDEVFTPYEKGCQAGAAAREKIHYKSAVINLVPEDYRVFDQSIHNTATGNEADISLREIRIKTDGQTNRLGWIEKVCGIFAIFMSIFFVVLLFSFITEIKKGEIFSKNNEFKLRWMAVVFLFWYIFDWVCILVDYSFSKSMFASESYHIVFEPANIYPLISGIIFLLFARIFALGRKMKEDQEFMV